jgi:hypothetical protein
MFSRCSIITFFLLLAICARSQDVIIKKNGNRINCRIIGIDSVSLFYTINNDKSFEIKKNDVERYVLSKNSPLLAENNNGKTNVVPVVTNTNELLTFNIHAGFAFPLLDFGSKDVDNEASGLAENGRLLDASLILKLTKHLGLNVSYKYQQHSFDHQALNDYLSALYPAITFVSESTPWVIRGFYGGLILSFPVKDLKGIYLTAGASAGLPNCILPSVETHASYQGSSIIVTQSSSMVRSLTFTESAGIRYRFSPTAALNLQLNYLHTKPAFSNIRTISTGGYVTYTDYKQKINTLSIMLGISFVIAQDK